LLEFEALTLSRECQVETEILTLCFRNQHNVGSGSKKSGGGASSGPGALSGGSLMPSFSQSLKNAERLEVTVIPVDDEPYSKIIQIPHALLGKQIESLKIEDYNQI
jgi:hypothetical protein